MASSRAAKFASAVARWCGRFDPDVHRPGKYVPLYRRDADGTVRGCYGYSMGGFLPGREQVCAYHGGTGRFYGGYYQRWLLRPDGGYNEEAVLSIYAQLARYGIRGRLAYSVRSDGYVFMYLRILSVSWANPQWKEAA